MFISTRKRNVFCNYIFRRKPKSACFDSCVRAVGGGSIKVWFKKYCLTCSNLAGLCLYFTSVSMDVRLFYVPMCLSCSLYECKSILRTNVSIYLYESSSVLCNYIPKCLSTYLVVSYVPRWRVYFYLHIYVYLVYPNDCLSFYDWSICLLFECRYVFISVCLYVGRYDVWLFVHLSVCKSSCALIRLSSSWLCKKENDKKNYILSDSRSSCPKFVWRLLRRVLNHFGFFSFSLLPII